MAQYDTVYKDQQHYQSFGEKLWQNPGASCRGAKCRDAKSQITEKQAYFTKTIPSTSVGQQNPKNAPMRQLKAIESRDLREVEFFYSALLSTLIFQHFNLKLTKKIYLKIFMTD